MISQFSNYLSNHYIKPLDLSFTTCKRLKLVTDKAIGMTNWDDNAITMLFLVVNIIKHTQTHTHWLPLSQIHTHFLNTLWSTPVWLRYKSDGFHSLTTWQTPDRERKRSEAQKSKCNNRSGLMKQQIQETEGKGNSRKAIKSQSIQCTSPLFEAGGGQLHFWIYIYFHNNRLSSDYHAVSAKSVTLHVFVYP